ncbi:MAG: pantoate--beta-alanine ligase [Chloroflexota bacterium]|nr:pantoate--beta-alanine ligase [Chloroflexota bacterium]
MLETSRGWRHEGLSIGLVPTMGALHAGHMSLVAAACRDNDKVVVSIFVNPIQFGAGEDLERYPTNVSRDLELLSKAGVAAVYMPTVAVMYPPASSTRVRVGGVAEPLEGSLRPGHFEGVATVVAKLMSAAQPDRAYFGQKDAQQAAVVKRLALDLDTGVEIRVCPTVREPDGLALSSRNSYLGPDERKAAGCLSRALRWSAEAYQRGERDPSRLRDGVLEIIAEEPLARLAYAELVDPDTFQPPGTLAVLAVWIGKTRLIDNHDLAQPFPG